MATMEKATDLWVARLLDEAKITLEPKKSSILEIDNALKSASKKGSKNYGFPEYVGVVKDFLIIIEDKRELSKHIKFDEDGVISLKTEDIVDYAVNGAFHYGLHMANETSYKKIFAIGVSGGEKGNRITPVFIDELRNYKILPDVKSFIHFNEINIVEYYLRVYLRQETDGVRETLELMTRASELHNDLRNYGNLKDIDKPLVVSGILLALRESERHGFAITDLTGDNVLTDGMKIYNAISTNLDRSRISPQPKKDLLLSQFSKIKSNSTLNKINPSLGKTPLRHYTEFIYEHLYRHIQYSLTSEDYIGRFYGEFMSYSGGDGKSLGIILTPKHITDLFCDLINIKVDDKVIDPCCGTGGFLISAMYHMLQSATTEDQRNSIKANQLHGIDNQDDMFTIATTNMILRGDGKSNLIYENFLSLNANELNRKAFTVGMINPPYSQGSSFNPSLYELSFVKHLLDSVSDNGRVIAILPQSAVTGKTKVERDLKFLILEKHTLEGVITLNKDTFYGVGVTPCIAIFKAGVPHPDDKMSKFIYFVEDGYEVYKHKGLLDNGMALDKKSHLLNVWFDRVEDNTHFCVKTTISHDDEWLHGYYYYNDTPAPHEEFEQAVNYYLSFEFTMIIKGLGTLVAIENEKYDEIVPDDIVELNEKEWRSFSIKDIFDVVNSKAYHKTNLTITNNQNNSIPYLTRSNIDNAFDSLVVKSTQFVANPSNTITFGAENATFFYQPFEYITGNKMYRLSSTSINKYTGLFLQTCLNESIKNAGFGYGKGLTGTRAKNRLFMLPVNEEGNPDFEYMRKYIRNLMAEKYEEYLQYVSD